MADPNAAAWAEMGFEASMIGVRAAVERALLDLRSIARNGGNVDGARRNLLALIHDLDVGSAGLLLGASPALPSFCHDPTPRGMGSADHWQVLREDDA